MAVTEDPWLTWPEDFPPGTRRPGSAPPRPERWYMRRELHLAIGILVAILTVFFAGQRATAGARATLDNRLVQGGADADAGLIAIESEQLSAARAVAFSQGVASALAAHDAGLR